MNNPNIRPVQLLGGIQRSIPSGMDGSEIARDRRFHDLEDEVLRVFNTIPENGVGLTYDSTLDAMALIVDQEPYKSVLYGKGLIVEDTDNSLKTTIEPTSMVMECETTGVDHTKSTVDEDGMTLENITDGTTTTLDINGFNYQDILIGSADSTTPSIGVVDNFFDDPNLLDRYIKLLVDNATGNVRMEGTFQRNTFGGGTDTMTLNCGVNAGLDITSYNPTKFATDVITHTANELSALQTGFNQYGFSSVLTGNYPSIEGESANIVQTLIGRYASLEKSVGTSEASGLCRILGQQGTSLANSFELSSNNTQAQLLLDHSNSQIILDEKVELSCTNGGNSRVLDFGGTIFKILTTGALTEVIHGNATATHTQNATNNSFTQTGTTSTLTQSSPTNTLAQSSGTTNSLTQTGTTNTLTQSGTTNTIEAKNTTAGTYVGMYANASRSRVDIGEYDGQNHIDITNVQSQVSLNNLASNVRLTAVGTNGDSSITMFANDSGGTCRQEMTSDENNKITMSGPGTTATLETTPTLSHLDLVGGGSYVYTEVRSADPQIQMKHNTHGKIWIIQAGSLGGLNFIYDGTEIAYVNNATGAWTPNHTEAHIYQVYSDNFSAYPGMCVFNNGIVMSNYQNLSEEGQLWERLTCVDAPDASTTFVDFGGIVMTLLPAGTAYRRNEGSMGRVINVTVDSVDCANHGNCAALANPGIYQKGDLLAADPSTSMLALVDDTFLSTLTPTQLKLMKTIKCLETKTIGEPANMEYWTINENGSYIPIDDYLLAIEME